MTTVPIPAIILSKVANGETIGNPDGSAVWYKVIHNHGPTLDRHTDEVWVTLDVQHVDGGIDYYRNVPEQTVGIYPPLKF